MSLTKLLLLTSAVVAALVIVGHIRPVQAEDDCAFNTWSVQRTPLGLICMWEPAR